MKTLGFTIEPTKLPEGRLKSLLRRYADIKYTDNLPGFIANGLPILLDPSSQKIAVSFSGGADSTMLLYMLCRAISEFKLPTKIVYLTVVRRWEEGEHLEKAKENILAYLEKKFSGIIVGGETGFLPSAYEFTPMASLKLSPDEKDKLSNFIDGRQAETYFFYMFPRWAARKHGFTDFYNGTTTNPVSAEMREAPAFRSAQAKALAQVSVEKPIDTYLGITISEHLPFQYVEKSWVTAQYKNFDVEDLFALTQSCENKFDGCGACFHCEERQWSMKESSAYWQENCRADMQGQHP